MSAGAFTFGAIASLASYRKDIANVQTRSANPYGKATVDLDNPTSPAGLRLKQAMEWGNLSFPEGSSGSSNTYSTENYFKDWAAKDSPQKFAASSTRNGFSNQSVYAFEGATRRSSVISNYSIGQYLSAMR